MQIDIFNFFNHTNFGQPNGNRGSSSFGEITGLRGFTNSRIIQLGAKVSFQYWEYPERLLQASKLSKC